eukprot:gene859-13867_t
MAAAWREVGKLRDLPALLRDRPATAFEYGVCQDYYYAKGR